MKEEHSPEQSARAARTEPSIQVDTKAFFRSLRDRGKIEEIFDLLPDVYFYIKDRDSRWMFCNKAALRSLNLWHLHDVVGLREFDFFPHPIAEAIRLDDLHVLTCGQKITNRIELILDESGHLAWVSTSKLPLLGTDGEIVGLMGITRLISTLDDLPEGYRRFQAAIDFIRKNLGSEINIEDLAKLSNLSGSQFRRRFKSLFRLAPGEFILRTRLQAAARRLSATQDPIIHIALDCGFASQSYFTLRFREFFGLSPNRYRRDWNSS